MPVGSTLLLLPWLLLLPLLNGLTLLSRADAAIMG
jgi:hypothetical protein